MYLNGPRNKVRAGALYYVIFLVFLLTAILSLLLLQRGIKLKQVREEIRYFEKLDDLDSGLALYLDQASNYQNSDSTSLVLFQDSSRRVNVLREAHGLFDLLQVRVKYHGKDLGKLVLAAANPFDEDSVALYVPDNNQGLYASGQTVINGNALLPSKGMQRASIEGKPLHRSKVIHGHIDHSQPKLPSLARRVRRNLKAVQDLDSLVLLSTDIFALQSGEMDRAFSEPIQWYFSDADYQISGINARGRIGFLSRGTILVKADAQLDQVIVSAKNIVIEEGFKGSAQFFACDSLLVGSQCSLDFPSVVCLNNENVNTVYLEIGTSSSLHGVLVCNQDHLSSEKPYLRILDGARIYGQVYHKGKIELLGSIYGSLYCENFYRKTPRAFYENHLLDNVIDFHRLPVYSSFIDLEQGHVDQVVEHLGYEL